MKLFRKRSRPETPVIEARPEQTSADSRPSQSQDIIVVYRPIPAPKRRGRKEITTEDVLDIIGKRKKEEKK